MFIIDRFEGQWVVIATDDRNTFNIPRNLLPINAKEGDVVTLTVVIDQNTTQKQRQKTKQLLDNFFDE